MNTTDPRLGTKLSFPDDGSQLIDIKSEAGELIGTCTDIDQARLWVAAPELLETAKAFVDAFRYRHGQSREIVDTLDKLISVIEKAEKP